MRTGRRTWQKSYVLLANTWKSLKESNLHLPPPPSNCPTKNVLSETVGAIYSITYLSLHLPNSNILQSKTIYPSSVLTLLYFCLLVQTIGVNIYEDVHNWTRGNTDWYSTLERQLQLAHRGAEVAARRMCHERHVKENLSCRFVP